MYMIIFLILSLWIHSFAFAYITPYKTFNRLRVTKLLKLWPKENSHQKTATTSNSVSNLKNMQLYFKTDEDDEEWEDISAPTINKDSTSSLSKNLKSATPILAALGFAVVPANSLVQRFATSALLGAIGLIGSKITANDDEEIDTDEIDDYDSNDGVGDYDASVLKALKRIENNGPPLDDLTSTEIENIAKRSGVEESKLSLLYSLVFAKVIYSTIQDDSNNFTDMAWVTDFAEDMELSDVEIGNGITIASVWLGKSVIKTPKGYFIAPSSSSSRSSSSSSDSESMLIKACKLYFIADKCIESLDGYFGNRLDVSLSYLTPDMLKSQITEESRSLYVRAIDSVLANPDKFSRDEIDSLQEYLMSNTKVSDLRPSNMQDIILKKLNDKVDADMDDGNKVGSDDVHGGIAEYDSLKKAQEVIGWSNFAFDSVVEGKTLPIFNDFIKSMIKTIFDDVSAKDELNKSFSRLYQSLHIREDKARASLITLMSARNDEYIEMLQKVYEKSNGKVDECFKIMTNYATAHAALSEIVKPVMNNYEIPLPGLPFADMTRVAMYEMKLEQKKSQVNDEMFTLNQAQIDLVERNLALPKIASWIKQCITEDNYDPMAKQTFEKMLKDYKVSDEEWQATAVDYYYQEAIRVSNMQAIPSTSDMERLASISNFLSCNTERVNQIHIDVFGDKYMKALSEAMMPAGIITEEYSDGLSRLQNRLSLSLSSAKSLLAVVTRQRMIPIMKNLVDQWKSQDKPSSTSLANQNDIGYVDTAATNGEEDKKDPTTVVFMREALNLVTFFEDNYGANEHIFKKDTSSSSSSSSSSSKLDMLPVSAVGSIPKEDLVGVLRQFLLNRLRETDTAMATRYKESEELFTSLLGIEKDVVTNIKESVVYAAYKSILTNIFSYSDSIGPQEFNQISSLVEKVGLINSDNKEDDNIAANTVEKILHKAGKFVMLKRIRALFEQPVVSASAVATMRSQIESLGLDMREDLSFNGNLISFLFAVEVRELVESGDHGSLLDIQESYAIPGTEAEALIQGVCKKYASQVLNIALRGAKRYDGPECLDYTDRYIRFSEFVDGIVDADGNVFNEKDKDQLISFYISKKEELTGGDSTSDYKDIVSKLRESINLNKEFVPPLEGIDGLVGKVTLPNAEEDENYQWAWG